MALQKKPPVVTIMGHVDHGKTSLLDYIRKTRIADKESGQITQAIGAYQIDLNGEKITFIDTPGHEAFSKMRGRGAKVADIVVLVVAGNDGVMPQTKECIQTILENKIPFVVAVTKIDLPQSSIEKVKTQLAENSVLVEGYGGNVPIVPVSSKTGQGIDSLLETILLLAEMEELKADFDGELQALVIESKPDKFCGLTATLIIQNGTLKLGDKIWCDNFVSKVKQIKDDKGNQSKQAYPGSPVLVLGFCVLPKVGSIISGHGSGESKESEADKYSLSGKPLEDKVNIILKADVFGSLEAILGCIPEEINVISAIGELSETDVMTAKSLNADIFVFNLPVSGNIEKLSQTEKVNIYSSKIIYELLEKINLKLKPPEIKKNILGKAQILQVFDIKGQKIAGCVVTEGKINKKFPITVQRGENAMADTKILSLKEQQQDVNEVGVNQQFGVVFLDKVDFQVGDMLISFNLE